MHLPNHEKLAPKKFWGCIAASPKFISKLSEEAYLFFFLAFFFAAILFSSRLRDLRQPKLAERVLSHHV
jgi:hypothetical protein